MKKLIIAEKPKLAKNIIAAIGTSSFAKKDGYYESEGYIVTWAFGHLFSLLDIEEYDPEYDPEEKHSWTLDGLPFVPNAFLFSLRRDNKTKKVDTGVAKQFKVISSLVKRKDVTTIVNAGDSDREGEIIIRIILDNAHNSKPVERLWMPDQTPETIKEELKRTRSDSEFDDIANEGYARTYIDWLYGINLTRYASIKSGKLLRVGRVTSPIVNAIYERDMLIKNFVPEKYLVVSSKEKTNEEVVALTSKKEFEKDDDAAAQKLCEQYNAAETKVIDAKTEAKIVPAGRLYSLSKLQGVLGRIHKMSPQKALDIVQKLYEEGYVTYPRTNTEYLATAEKGKVKGIISKVAAEGYPVKFKDNKSIFDDSKIESHSALTPTGKMPPKSSLSADEQKVYDIILKRFVAVFCAEDCVVDRSTIKIDNGYEVFTLKGDMMVKKGWTAYDINEKKDNILPKLAVGDIINVNFKVSEKETTPPKHYTVDTFNKFLKNPFKKEMDEEKDDVEEDAASEEKEYKAMMSGAELGTEATRAGLIDAAIKSQYILLKDNSYYITEMGIYYVETLQKLFIDMSKNKTVELGVNLKQVRKGDISIGDSVAIAVKEIREVFAHQSDVEVDAFAVSGEVICTCPKCGHDIVETDKAYACKNSSCGIVIFKEDKFFGNFGKKVPAPLAKMLFTKGKVNIKGLKSPKSGNKFDVVIKVTFEGKYPKYDMLFDEPTAVVVGKCPRCGGDVKETPKTYSCTNESCDFAMWKKDKFLETMGKTLTPTIAKAFLSSGKAHVKGLKSKKSGKLFDATVVVDYSEKYPKYSLEFQGTEK